VVASHRGVSPYPRAVVPCGIRAAERPRGCGWRPNGERPGAALGDLGGLVGFCGRAGVWACAGTATAKAAFSCRFPETRPPSLRKKEQRRPHFSDFFPKTSNVCLKHMQAGVSCREIKRLFERGPHGHQHHLRDGGAAARHRGEAVRRAGVGVHLAARHHRGGGGQRGRRELPLRQQARPADRHLPPPHGSPERRAAPAAGRGGGGGGRGGAVARGDPQVVRRAHGGEVPAAPGVHEVREPDAHRQQGGPPGDDPGRALPGSSWRCSGGS
jgi:hypothetical protein